MTASIAPLPFIFRVAANNMELKSGFNVAFMSDHGTEVIIENYQWHL
jgi:hypothetical protein